MARQVTAMARTPLTMRQINEILRLKYQCQLSVRDIARSCGLPTSTVGDYLGRAEAAQLVWPLPEGMSQEQLHERLLKAPGAPASASKPLPAWEHLHQELRRKGVTMQLLWQEYRRSQPDGYGYSRFCELYQRWAKTLDPVMRQVHAPGEKLFVDWAGQTMPIHNGADGSLTQAHLFVAVLGASNLLYAEAFPNEQLENWIAGHAHAYSFLGGVPKVTVPDNPKTGVTQACRYEPQLQRTYEEMAGHYGTVILPARPKKPRDKAKVETGVQIAERQILAALRDQRFFTIGELNQAIVPLLNNINTKPFQKLEGSRQQFFQEQEKSQLLPLPASPFIMATWSQVTVNIDYHVAVEKHFYSVPYDLVHQQLQARVTATTVEIFQTSKRVAAHVRSHLAGRFTTLEEHRPKSHQRHGQWTPGRLISWAQTVGQNCGQVAEQILKDRPHPEQGYRSCLGIMRLGRVYGTQRLEAACVRALHCGTCSYASINSILKSKLDAQAVEQELPLASPVHGNLRGSAYYA
jgi:transposase